MPSQTRSTTRKHEQMMQFCPPHRFNFLIDQHDTIKVTRSLTKALKIIGLNVLTKQELPQKIRVRRVTCPAFTPKPKKRSTRLQTLPDYKTTQTSVAHSNKMKWCVCRRESFGNMIFCENPQCTIKWFHMDCMKVTTIPEGDWFCQNCLFFRT
ncbi:inhibitor of growth protein 5-like isoform X2 [Contarinia nasturtii]|uniref:inhibitor of growth protein 5-like isoform X2 n=1 Tax=Contarinia nasturtii TaxID=265458 RepID=UPI0012D44C33|nr:inhibitor of growth protein 5-like isoform X2 [Contarinia nasturtii]XP_031633604.1 inhibitor of growth protein 5-like isoform X2 [Contarinia nasturtii]